MIIGIDFDGTCVTHDFPDIGKDIGAIPVLKRLIASGHKLVLWTMRSDIEVVSTIDPTIHAAGGKYLSAAVDWFCENGIPLYGVNENPEQRTWTDSPKAYCQLYIDDAALGCPLYVDNSMSAERGNVIYADWKVIDLWLLRNGYYEDI